MSYRPATYLVGTVAMVCRMRLAMPRETMLCTLWVLAVTEEGSVAARNYVQFFVDAGAAERESVDSLRVLRAEPQAFHAAEWSGASSDHEAGAESGSVFGEGHGWFEWRFPREELRDITRLRVLCEASSRREGAPQTDSFAHATRVILSANGTRIHEAILPNHPHDARGALSYLRGGVGAYGYLVSAALEGALLAQVLERAEGDDFVLRLAVPAGAEAGGLTVYGRDCGRFPLPLTLIVERS